MAQALGRVVDSSALDACAEPRGRHAIEIPVAWVGAEILVAIPARISCARCDGGGCDGCNRRGGHRITGDEEDRSVRVKLPRVMDGTVVLRLVRPFGDEEGAIAQLHLEARVGSAASAGVVLCVLASTEVTVPQTPMGVPRTPSRHVGLVVAAAFVLGILVALSTMR